MMVSYDDQRDATGFSFSFKLGEVKVVVVVGCDPLSGK